MNDTGSYIGAGLAKGLTDFLYGKMQQEQALNELMVKKKIQEDMQRQKEAFAFKKIEEQRKFEQQKMEEQSPPEVLQKFGELSGLTVTDTRLVPAIGPILPGMLPPVAEEKYQRSLVTSELVPYAIELIKQRESIKSTEKLAKQKELIESTEKSAKQKKDYYQYLNNHLKYLIEERKRVFMTGKGNVEDLDRQITIISKAIEKLAEKVISEGKDKQTIKSKFSYLNLEK